MENKINSLTAVLWISFTVFLAAALALTACHREEIPMVETVKNGPDPPTGAFPR